MTGFVIDHDWLDRLYPAHLVVDDALRIVQVGPAMARLNPAARPGVPLPSCLPALVPADVAAAAAQRTAVRIPLGSDGIVLIGSIMAQASGYLLALNIAPGPDALEAGTLNISDFAPDDPMVSGLLMISLQKALLAEAEQVSKELLDERQRAIDLMERFSRAAGYMAHDFSNFLSIITLNCNRIRNDPNLSPRQQRCIDIVIETAGRGSDVTRSLLTLAQQKHDAQPAYTIDGFIARNAALFSSLARGGVEVRLDLAAPEAHVVASGGGLMNCLINLLINAREAMPAGGTITISTGVIEAGRDGAPHDLRPGRYVILRCADTGIGMDHDTAVHAFDPFFSTKPKGSGIGLASVRDFVRETGGTIALASALGEGTTISIFLPMAPPPAVDTPFAPPPPPATSGKPRVLVVEDEVYALEALREILDDEDYLVSTALSADEARDYLASTPHDLLLTDVIMPGESGIELARWVERHRPETRIVLMSGFVPGNDALHENWLFLRKPLDPDRLRSMLRTALTR